MANIISTSPTGSICVILTAGERNTILAALRCWQASTMRGTGTDYDEIAGENGEALDSNAIDALCEAINV